MTLCVFHPWRCNHDKHNLVPMEYAMKHDLYVGIRWIIWLPGTNLRVHMMMIKLGFGVAETSSFVPLLSDCKNFLNTRYLSNIAFIYDRRCHTQINSCDTLQTRIKFKGSDRQTHSQKRNCQKRGSQRTEVKHPTLTSADDKTHTLFSQHSSTALVSQFLVSNVLYGA